MPAHEPLSSQNQKALEDYIKTLEDLLDRSQQLNPSIPAQQAAMAQWEQDLSEILQAELGPAGKRYRGAAGAEGREDGQQEAPEYLLRH